MIQAIENESKIMKSSDNQFIIKYLDYFSQRINHSKIFYLITPYYEVNYYIQQTKHLFLQHVYICLFLSKNGSLNEKIGECRAMNNNLSKETVLKWSTQILSGLKYLHEKTPHQIIHRDIKPE